MSQSPDRVDAAVSYSRADQARVEQLLAGLKASGLVIWFDKDIPGGALWEEIIARKYRASGALLFFVSKASLASQRCSEEVSTARTLGKPIIPILLDPLKLPDDLPDRFVLTLQARNTVAAHDRPHEEIEAAILAALGGFGIAAGAAPPPSALPASAPVVSPAPRKAEEKKRRGGALLAFGGAALALVLVAGAYFLFIKPPGSAPASVESGTKPPVASLPPAPPPAPVPADPRPAPVPADPTTPPASKPPTGETTIALDKTDYREGDEVVVSLKGLPGNKKDWVAIAEAGTPDTVYLFYVYTDEKKDGDFKMKPLMRAGRYEVRVFYDEPSGDKTVRARQVFEVAPFPPPTLALDRTSYAEGQPITATVGGMLGAEDDWVAVAKADAAPSVFVSYTYTKGAEQGPVKLKPVMKPGAYEVRVFFADRTGDKTIRARLPFEVTAADPVALMVDGDVYAPGAPIEIAFSGMPGNARDWISIAPAGAADTGFASYAYTNGEANGTVEMRAPETPGLYELRAYFDDSTGDKTVRGRESFEVAAPGAEADPEPAPEPVTDPEVEPEPEPAAVEPDPVSEPDPAAEPPVAEPEPVADPEPAADPADDPATDPAPASGADPAALPAGPEAP
jgi:hypothetical protein